MADDLRPAAAYEDDFIPLVGRSESEHDPYGDAEAMAEESARKNYAKVGSQRPSSLLYTNGPGAIVDLPNFTVMPSGYDFWDGIWKRRDGDPPTIHAPRLLDTARTFLGHQVKELRPYPRQAKKKLMSRDGDDLGVPARVFPQMFRCTGCDELRPLSHFDYDNSSFYRPDLARFEHVGCSGRRRNPDGSSVPAKRVDPAARGKGIRRSPAIPARYLLVCPNGHLDEFPYDEWVHRGGPCKPGIEVPVLKMLVGAGGKGANATILCESCGKTRGMAEAQGRAGLAKLPTCRGRHPHLEGFEEKGCDQQTRIMLVGASNLWFAVTQSVIVMPLSTSEEREDLAAAVRLELGDKLRKYAENPGILRDLLDDRVDLSGVVSDEEFAGIITRALVPLESEEARQARVAAWDPVDILVPEWDYLRDFVAKGNRAPYQSEKKSGLVLSLKNVPPRIRPEVGAVVAVDRLRKANAFLGFTRIDELDRVGDVGARLVRVTERKPTWVVATEDRGEGIFLSLDEERVAGWESYVLANDAVVWPAHREAHVRNFANRLSETADEAARDNAREAAERRLPPPRYWLLHSLSHALIREMALHAGYGAASLTERLYAYQGSDERHPAASVMICTTASDSDGTLGGLVRLSEPRELGALVVAALRRSTRCSSDPVCAIRLPAEPEDFLHGAACHACLMASETSCERANRFLDRRFLIPLPGTDPRLAFFADLLSRGQG